ncbi:hypothetical protein ACQZ6F_27235 [Rhizobium sp. A22-96]
MDAMTETDAAGRVQEILTAIKPLAAEYYRLTGRPLGVIGEVAAPLAAEVLNLELAPPRTVGYDAIRHRTDGSREHIQIKGRAYSVHPHPSQLLGRVKQAADCHTVLLVLLDNVTLDLCEIWEAPYSEVAEQFVMPGSNSPARGALSVIEFKRVAIKVWPVD